MCIFSSNLNLKTSLSLPLSIINIKKRMASLRNFTDDKLVKQYDSDVLRW